MFVYMSRCHCYPYSPIGGGILSGKYNAGEMPVNSRFAEYQQASEKRQRAMADRFLNEGTLASTASYLEIADAAGSGASHPGDCMEYAA
jgi:aryl-alcohol dehydrogenase-like predicted oxidoreductase